VSSRGELSSVRVTYLGGRSLTFEARSGDLSPAEVEG
jgi:hypothetical protein